jgi:hypothetical protein
LLESRLKSGTLSLHMEQLPTPERTKEIVQAEYNATAGQIGDLVYKACLPFLKIAERLRYAYSLSLEYDKLLIQEMEKKKNEPVATAQNG